MKAYDPSHGGRLVKRDDGRWVLRGDLRTPDGALHLADATIAAKRHFGMVTGRIRGMKPGDTPESAMRRNVAAYIAGRPDDVHGAISELEDSLNEVHAQAPARAAQAAEDAANEAWESQATDPDGKTPKALRGKTVWLYHGTSDTFRPDIERNGLDHDPGHWSNVGATATSRPTAGYTYLTSDPDAARRYARGAAAKHGGSPTVLRVAVPFDDLERDADDADISSGRSQWRIDRRVTPHEIKEFDGQRREQAKGFPSMIVLTWTREAAKAIQLGLGFGQADGGPAGDPSRGGRLVKEIRVHSNGRRVSHWVMRPEAAAPEAPRPAPREGGRERMRYEQKADVARIWRMEAESAYSGLLPVVAVREAAQNGIDAVRKALKRGDVTEGRFDVSYDRNQDRIVIADNGVGMDRQTLQDKFLTLGATGKGDDAAAVGGFGVAKAAILGSPDFQNGGSWEIRTNDIRLTSDMLGRDLQPGEDVAEHNQGVRITLDKPAMPYWKGDFEGQTVELLASSDIGKGISATFNGKAIRPMWQGLRGKVMDFAGIEWPAGTTAKVTRFKVPSEAGRQGKVFVRVGGLTQWSENFYAKKGSQHDYVIDLDITARPGSKEYPLQKSRQGFQGQADGAYREVKSAVERELQDDESTKRAQEWEDLDIDAEGRVRSTTGETLMDEEPDDIAEMLKGMGGAEALHDIAQVLQEVAGPSVGSTPSSVNRSTWGDNQGSSGNQPWEAGGDSIVGVLMGAVQQAGGDVDRLVSRTAVPRTGHISAREAEQHAYDEPQHDHNGDLLTTPMRVMDGKDAGKLVHVSETSMPYLRERRPVAHDLPHHNGELLVTQEENDALREHARDEFNESREHPLTYTRIARNGDDPAWGDIYLPPETIAEKLREMRGIKPQAKATPEAAPEADGEVVARGGKTTQGRIVRDDYTHAAAKDARLTGTVKTGFPFAITRNNAGWPKRKKLNMKKVGPGLLIWDSVIRATGSAAGVHDRMKAGLVLDNGVLGLHNFKSGIHNIFIHPEHLLEQLGPKVDPMTAAVRLHNIACHEMAHNRYGDHDEDFSSHTEDLRRKSAHVVPALAAIIERVTGRRSAGSAQRDKLAKGLEKAKATAATQRAESAKRIKALEAEVKRLGAIQAAPAPAPAPKPPERDIFAETQHELAERRGMVKGAHAAGISEFRHHTRDAYTAVGPDPSKPGRFRSTRYDADGLAGHTEHATIGDALHHIAREGYVHPAPGSMDKIVTAAPQPQAVAAPAGSPAPTTPGQLGLFGGEQPAPAPKKRTKAANPDQLGFSFKAVGRMLGAVRVSVIDFGGNRRAAS